MLTQAGGTTTLEEDGRGWCGRGGELDGGRREAQGDPAVLDEADPAGVLTYAPINFSGIDEWLVGREAARGPRGFDTGPRA